MGYLKYTLRRVIGILFGKIYHIEDSENKIKYCIRTFSRKDAILIAIVKTTGRKGFGMVSYSGLNCDRVWIHTATGKPVICVNVW